jgi:hypothetical protein
MKIRNRIKEIKQVKAKDLLPNPKNWRTHPQAQRDALKGVLAEVGIAGVLLAMETPDGLMLIDGHARAEVDANQEWTVAVLDVTPKEADYLLATVDPLSSLAEADSGLLESILHDVNSGNDAVRKMLAQLAEDEGIIPPDFQPVGIEEQGKLDEKAKVKCPECGHEFSTK